MSIVTDAIASAQAASNRVLGGAGRVADTVLKNTPTVVKAAAGTATNLATNGLIPADIYTKERGLTEQAENQAGYALSQTNPAAAQAKVAVRNSGVTPTQQQLAPTTPVSQVPTTTSQKYTTTQMSQMGIPEGQQWNMNEVTVGGQKYTVIDNGDGTRSLRTVSAGGGGGEEQKQPFDVNAAINKAGGQDALNNLTQGQLDDFMKKYADGMTGNADDLAADIERTAKENADRDYNDVMGALRGQKAEVGTLSEQQKKNTTNEAALTTAELDANMNTEVNAAEKQKAGYIEEKAATEDKLGRSWRDMSLEIQRIMRGKGVADSSYATDKEVGVLKDFNAGLRELSVKSAGALKDLADGVTEAVAFYSRKKASLAEEVRQNVESIDTWVRQTVTDIQNKENQALSSKLREINDATVKAKELKTNVATQIAQAELNYGMWLKQVQVNYKMAVATAAKGKVQSASDKIAEAAALSKNMMTLLDNGSAQFVQTKTGGVAIQDSITGAIIPSSSNYKDEYDQQKALDLQIKSKSATLSTSQLAAQKMADSIAGAIDSASQ